MAARDILFLTLEKKFTFISGEMTILVFFRFGFNIVTNFVILTEIWYCLLTVQDLLRSCVFVNIYGCKREPLVRTICPRSRTPSFNLPLTLVNGISCCFPDGAGMNATWKESVKSGLVGTQDFATCLY